MTALFYEKNPIIKGGGEMNAKEKGRGFVFP